MNSVSIYHDILQFLNRSEADFLEEWWQSITLHQNDIHKDKVKENGLQMYLLTKSSLQNLITEEEIMLLAYKVAKERVEANVNISDFVHNVNLGRSIVTRHIFLSGSKPEHLHAAIDVVNKTFDLFCYHAVKKYSVLKELEIEEKNILLNETHKVKLTLLGQMSSSFVHEFRNPLTAVIGFIKLLKTDYPNLKYLDIIDHELDQLKFRITQFLHTSKNEGAQEQRKEVVAIRQLLEEIIKFLYPSIVDIDVNVITSFGQEAKTVANKNELKQVFLNILMNSIDAITKKEKPREIYVETFTEGNYVIIEISNNGPIIPDETREIIFEPFYTTKELGTGIGLFVCRKIIEKHRGDISCRSNEELTTFVIRLPLLV
ncbi:GHKL domain-containing protein [Anaerobacillus alkaliphilus]|uniref:histidine kinase n=1 Tax=Anaerobacillus alkaliphilus TaxID=1548597 RepID=A0A4Q0VU04_9BACI|nr:histidine kinase N-terminal domain-containing protein [Anaerobacillus alkaliphilus]RXJ00702.1 GHKL domain-containing protein [Anaerobacillus alkaliphilus]